MPGKGSVLDVRGFQILEYLHRLLVEHPSSKNPNSKTFWISCSCSELLCSLCAPAADPSVIPGTASSEPLNCLSRWQICSLHWWEERGQGTGTGQLLVVGIWTRILYLQTFPRWFCFWPPPACQIQKTLNLQFLGLLALWLNSPPLAHSYHPSRWNRPVGDPGQDWMGFWICFSLQKTWLILFPVFVGLCPLL